MWKYKAIISEKLRIFKDMTWKGLLMWLIIHHPQKQQIIKGSRPRKSIAESGNVNHQYYQDQSKESRRQSSPLCSEVGEENEQ